MNRAHGKEAHTNGKTTGRSRRRYEGTAVFLLFLGLFLGIIGLVYWFWSHEDGGGMMLLGVTLLGFLPGLYYFFWHRRFHGHKYFFWGKSPPRVTVRPTARTPRWPTGPGSIDAFPGSSIWPFVMGMGAFMTVLALVFGVWLIFIGVPADPHRADRRHGREPARRQRLNQSGRR